MKAVYTAGLLHSPAKLKTRIQASALYTLILDSETEGAGALHGEKVAYGILCQLTAEEEWEELNKIRAFYRTVGLPLHLADMGVPATEENLRIICADTIHTEWSREPFEMNDEKVYQVLRQVEQMGREE